jgi:tRNA A37 methylthiotransferase MiaB
MSKKLFLETVGCQMNVLDSERVVGSLRRNGLVLTDEATDADVILFNTCSVRQHAEDKIYSALGRLLELQPAGKRRMAAAEFLRGHRLQGGDRFGPEMP